MTFPSEFPRSVSAVGWRRAKAIGGEEGKVMGSANCVGEGRSGARSVHNIAREPLAWKFCMG